MANGRSMDRLARTWDFALTRSQAAVGGIRKAKATASAFAGVAAVIHS
jgi:hypothetical protein